MSRDESRATYRRLGRRALAVVAVLGIAATGAAWSGCDDDEDVSEQIEQAGDEAREQGEEIGEEAQEQGEEITDEAQEQIEEGTEETQEGSEGGGGGSGGGY